MAPPFAAIDHNLNGASMGAYDSGLRHRAFDECHSDAWRFEKLNRSPA
jgi:hypothetical protein